MAVPVVDGLETIQIQKHHCQALMGALGVRHGLLQTVNQQHPVGQPGQHVEMRHALQRGLLHLERRDVVNRHLNRRLTLVNNGSALDLHINGGSIHLEKAGVCH